MIFTYPFASSTRGAHRGASLGACILATALSLAGCDPFDAPPAVAIEGLVEGQLPDPTAPFTVTFSEPIKPESLAFKLVVYETDGEGRLFDQDEDAATELDVLFRSDPETEEGGLGQLDEARRVFTATLSKTMPVGPQLALVVDSGLADDAGRAWKVRQIIKFGFAFSCGDQVKPTTFPERGTYFFLVDVDKPVSAQIQLLADIRVDPDSGDFVGQFTNGDRNPALDCSTLGLSCKDTEACRTYPEPACVPPSEKTSGADGYVDFSANFEPPTGYSFTVRGCVTDSEGGGYSFGNLPVDVVVQSPPITVKAINLQSAWTRDDEGVLRGSGSFTAEQVYLGPSPSGAGVGSSLARSYAAEELPPIPAPPAD